VDETELGVTQLRGGAAINRRAPPGPQRLQRGDELGRYVVIDVLGHGGMGVVYSAFDPKLGRSVAIKLLQSALDSSLGASDGGRGRLLREAQALAQLQHPNVITVHDVGEHERQVFVAMEHIHGLTLRRWLDTETRSWREVLDVMQRAGQGLGAAHAKGMVHRDFKPDNVMLATDESGAIERVLVMDFGLATAVGSRPPLPTDTPADITSLSSSEMLVDLTRTGAVMGTPAYMAPEQHAGARTDARTDQFSFCVTLYEALYGQRPFAGDTLPALVAACIGGRMTPAPRGSAVPRWIGEIIERGLAADPERRWPSMAALLDAFGKDPTRRRRRLAIAALGVGALGLAYAGSVLVERSRLADCRAMADSIDEVWNAEARTRTRAGVLGTGLVYAPSTWERLEPLIDDRTERWRTLRFDACADRQGVSDELRVVQVECFESSKAAVADLLEILAKADGLAINRATSAVASWARVTPCTSPGQLARRARWPDEPEARARVVELDRRIQRATVLSYAGHFEEAEELAEASFTEAMALEQPRHAVIAGNTRGWALLSLGHFALAEAVYEDSFFVARQNAADDLAAIGASQLAKLVGHDLARPTDGRRWMRHAEILADDAELDALDRAFIDYMYGLLELGGGRFEAARDHLDAALTVYESELGLDSLRAIDVREGLAQVHEKLGDHELAIEELEQVVAWSEQMYGSEHPATAEAHNNLAVALLHDRRLADARLHLERAIALYQRVGLEAKLATPLDNLALVLRETGHPYQALELSARALEVRRQTLPEDHPDFGVTFINHGQILGKLGARRAAIADFTAAVAIYERALDPEHPRVAEALYTLGVELGRIGDHRRALAEHQRGLRIRRASLPAEHPYLAWSTVAVVVEARKLRDYALLIEEAQPLMSGSEAPASLPGQARAGLTMMFGEALLETGRTEEALVWLERATTLADVAEAEDRADIDFNLARARWELDRDRPGALALARRGVVDLRKTKDANPEQIAGIERWLAAHTLDASASTAGGTR
jgi:tetratricopeptide (TPR) repeat protein/tRNA A-37 threonylcarbamoyl transferase component Bud32